MPTVVAPYARRTTRLSVVVEAIALALGGEGGTRILAALGLALSPDTLLNCIRAATRPAISLRCISPLLFSAPSRLRGCKSSLPRSFIQYN